MRESGRKRRAGGVMPENSDEGHQVQWRLNLKSSSQLRAKLMGVTRLPLLPVTQQNWLRFCLDLKKPNDNLNHKKEKLHMSRQGFHFTFFFFLDCIREIEIDPSFSHKANLLLPQLYASHLTSTQIA